MKIIACYSNKGGVGKTASAVNIAHALAERCIDVVVHVVGTDLPQPLELALAAGAGEHLAAAELGDLHAGDADAATGAEHQDLFAGADLADGDHHAPGRAVGERQAGGRLEADAVRQLDEVGGGYGDLLCPPAVDGFANHVRLAVVEVDGVHEHSLALPLGIDAVPQCADGAGDVGADHHWKVQFDARHAAAGEDVVEVHGAGRDVEHDLTGPRTGGGVVVAVGEDRAVPVCGGEHGLHGTVLGQVALKGGMRLTTGRRCCFGGGLKHYCLPTSAQVPARSAWGVRP
mgnify:CR=1 FL=1